MKYLWREGEIAHVIVRAEVLDRMKNSTVLSFWTGEKFVSGGNSAYMDSKLYKTKKLAEESAAQMILADPKRLFGVVEVIEQVVWKDIRA